MLVFCKLIAENNTFAKATLMGKQIFAGAINIHVTYLGFISPSYRYINEAFTCNIRFFSGTILFLAVNFRLIVQLAYFLIKSVLFSLADISQSILPFISSRVRV